MKRCLIIIAATAAAILPACSPMRGAVRGADETAVIARAGETLPDPQADPEGLLKKYTVEFRIPNPLIDQGVTTPRFGDPNHEAVILCRAVLLDSLSTIADIAAKVKKDSLSTAAADSFRAAYLAEQVKPGRFRIRITMESGFSPKSLDPDQWVMRLVTTKGVDVEPRSITATPAVSASDSIYSSFHRMSLPRTLIRSDLTLVFDRVTFFGEDLLGAAEPHLILEMVREQRTVARVAWSRGGKR